MKYKFDIFEGDIKRVSVDTDTNILGDWVRSTWPGLSIFSFTFYNSSAIPPPIAISTLGIAERMEQEKKN